MAAGQQRGAGARRAGARAPLAGGRGEQRPQAGEGDQPERQVDVEDPAPARALDQSAADQRADDGGHGERGGDVALVAARSRGETRSPTAAIASVISPPAAAPWTARAHDELGDVLGHAAQGRGGEEQGQRDLEQPLAPVAVAELAPERRGGGGGDDVGRDHPRDVGDAAEVGGDGRQRRGEDRLVEDRGQHRQHDRREAQGDRRVRPESAALAGPVVRLTGAHLVPSPPSLLRHNGACPLVV